MSFTGKLKSVRKSARNKAFNAAMLLAPEEIKALKKKAVRIIELQKNRHKPDNSGKK